MIRIPTRHETFAYHGDFDWGGIAIAAAVHERVGFLPWRFDAASYRAIPSSAQLSGPVRPTLWDPELSVAMERRGVRVEEELVLAELIAALAPKGRGAHYGPGICVGINPVVR
ncbi:DUF2399 domain-containing protein [Nonomuraea sp. NPDC050153]|uniref:DUF2399 domain-containing protein n=1 Tax=Nonomuraea sp. NPDC050153 TaxID=3364359 RepID=UPI00379FE066